MLWLLRRATALFSTRMRERTLSVYKDVHRRERLPFDDADRRCVTTCGPVCAPARGAGAGRTRLPLRPCPVQLARRRAGLTVYITHLTLNAGACSRDLCAPSGRTLEFSASGEDEIRFETHHGVVVQWSWRGQEVERGQVSQRSLHHLRRYHAPAAAPNLVLSGKGVLARQLRARPSK